MSVTTINSDSVLSNFESHFKVSAGPGAGKTTWLVGQINNVLSNSKRLGITRKVACITYTNIAVETITKRLGDGIHQVEVSTIHSFLYNYVLKPYAHFLPASYELDASKIRGHDDKVLTGYDFLRRWKGRTGQARIRDDKAVAEALYSLRWTIDGSGMLSVGTKYPHKADGYPIKTASYLDYKKMAWSMGVIHHDDVLFLSYELIRLFPFILEVIRARFPYFFIDEFQDINPIQLQLLNSILQKETIVGIVGDTAQSIYGFMGAKSTQFNDFKPAGIQEFQIKDNWRSTDKIVDLLNLVRPDLHQDAKRGVVGTKPTILIGEKNSCHQKMLDTAATEDVCTLSRDNLVVNAIRKGVTATSVRNIIAELSADSNSARRRTILWCAKGIEYAEQGYFRDALKEIAKIHDKDDEQTVAKRSLETLKILLKGKVGFVNGSLMELYDFINSSGIAVLTKPTGTAIKDLYNKASYMELAVNINAINESLPYRTIHKSKGDEFECVLLVLSEEANGSFKEEDELGFLLDSNLNDEEQRIRYVAISRAKNELFVRVPSLTTTNNSRLVAMGFDIIDCR